MNKKLRALLKAKKRDRDKKISTKLGIVYAKKHETYEVLPYFDVSRKHRICGISIKETCSSNEVLWISKEDIGKDLIGYDSYRCSALINQAYASNMDIPCYDDMLRIYFNRDELNKVIALFKEYGISADTIEGPYIINDKSLESDLYSTDDILIYHLHGNKAATYERVSITAPYLTRLVKHW